MYHIGKHALKYVAFTHDYDISSLPLDEAGVRNDLILSIDGMELSES